jgi:hypothetical protein
VNALGFPVAPYCAASWFEQQYFGKCRVRISAGIQTVLTEIARSFLRSLQVDMRPVPQTVLLYPLPLLFANDAVVGANCEQLLDCVCRARRTPVIGVSMFPRNVGIHVPVCTGSQPNRTAVRV